jgi:GNAT superfamily N-acetyltransferase
VNKFYFYQPKILKIMVKIREAITDDAPHIIDFQLKMALETENVILDKKIITNGVNAVFNDSGKGQYYIIEGEGNIAGSMLTTFEWSDWRNGMVIWFQSVYVLPEFRGKGLFSDLYHYFEEMVSKREDLRGIRLYVDKTNQHAQLVYQKVGMSNEHYEMYEWLK